uniref:Glycosyltransferase n=1 Tax=Gynostemma pentaphyllum TaxID=182084 RepID=A0A8F2F5Y9_GYNPE|nr:7-deoxyloganetic acid glucosyltransferase [Gynostemma pentaphyllum]
MAEPQQPRILLFPFPAPGHIKPFLILAELLSDAGLDVVFLTTEFHHRLISNLETLITRFPKLHFATMADDLPPENPRDTMDSQYFISLLLGTKPRFQQFLHSFNEANNSQQITCIISDVIISAPFEVAEEFGIPVVSFCTYSARYLSMNFFIEKLIEEGQIPYHDDNPLGEITGVASFEEGILRRKHLPGFWNVKYCDQSSQMMVINQTVSFRRSSGLILNTFNELEAQHLRYLSSIFKKVYPIGPIHALSNSKLGDFSFSSSSSIGKKEDETCIPWLDSQASKSVIYVSFGTLAKMKSEELIEFWHGLVNSEKPFLCVLRKDVVNEGEEAGKLIKQLVGEGGEKVKGITVEWAPQEKVLKHPSVGGFLTHCGWNSMMESIEAGVPMIGWPVLGDQPSNATWIEQVWKIGFEIKEKWDRLTVEKMVRALMEDPKKENEIQKCVEKFSKFANESVSKSGLSFKNFESLIEELKKLSTK